MMNRMLGLSFFAMRLPFQEFMFPVISRAHRRDFSGISDLGSVSRALARTTWNANSFPLCRLWHGARAAGIRRLANEAIRIPAAGAERWDVDHSGAKASGR